MRNLDEARRLFELFTREIEAIFATSEESLQKQNEIGQQQEALKVKLGDVQTKYNQIETEKTSILEEKAFIQKAMAQKERETQVLEVKQKRLDDDRVILESERAELKRAKDSANLVIIKAQGVEEELRRIAYERQLIEKEKAMDHERKEMLDIREQRIVQTEDRLRKLSNV